MWYTNKDVLRTHCKQPSQQAWAIVKDVASGWLRISPGAPDAVTAIYMMLSTALANARKVDVYVQNGEITQVTLH